ncbi:acylphosphatase [bacterium]|nr:acylphosphatase [bacterium]
MKEAQIKIYGAVQGVGFRFAAFAKAKGLGLKGFARNEPDKSVLIMAEGEESNLDDFIAWCRKGPSIARVDRIDIEKFFERKHFDDFKIEY